MDIVYKFTEVDGYEVPRNGLVCKMSDYRYTFWKSQLCRLPGFIKPIGIDLLMLSLAVYGADRWILRKSASDGWKRKIHIHLPVLELEKMNENKRLLTEILDFLSGDEWQLSFRQRDFTSNENKWRKKIDKSKMEGINVDRFCMFSGGLDSFIGAIDLLEENPSNVAFVSTYGGGKGVKEYQTALRKELASEYKLDEAHFFSFFVVPYGGKEDTMRSRSFMFFSHAIALASSFEGSIDLFVPENGFISLNVPLTYSRIGTSSTRTTHPHYMQLLQQLVGNLGLNLQLKNPYQFRTKGEMLLECTNQSFLARNISSTMSCSHPDVGRMRGESETQHCGTCLPCVIRRAAIKTAGIKETAQYYDPDFTSGDTARTNLNSYLQGLHKYKESKAYLAIQSSGPLRNDIENYESIYKRGMAEMKDLLGEYDETS